MTIKNIFITVANLENEIVEGKEFNYAQFKSLESKFGAEHIANFMEEHGFYCLGKGVVEMHVFNPESHDTVETLCGGYPVVSLDHARQCLVLESCMGSGQENKVVCKSVLIQSF